jgi:hypothetical protein
MVKVALHDAKPSDDFHWSRSNGRPQAFGVGEGVEQKILGQAVSYVMALSELCWLLLLPLSSTRSSEHRHSCSSAWTFELSPSRQVQVLHG